MSKTIESLRNARLKILLGEEAPLTTLAANCFRASFLGNVPSIVDVDATCAALDRAIRIAEAAGLP